jgi:hypothetical protein
VDEQVTLGGIERLADLGEEARLARGGERSPVPRAALGHDDLAVGDRDTADGIRRGWRGADRIVGALLDIDEDDRLVGEAHVDAAVWRGHDHRRATLDAEHRAVDAAELGIVVPVDVLPGEPAKAAAGSVVDVDRWRHVDRRVDGRPIISTRSARTDEGQQQEGSNHGRTLADGRRGPYHRCHITRHGQARQLALVC